MPISCVEPVPLIDRILSWTSYLAAEDKFHLEVMNIDLIMTDYYWTREFKGFVENLVNHAPNLIFLVGLQGSGKTSALKVINSYMIGKCDSLYFRLGEHFDESMLNYIKECRFLLIDLPDYEVGGGRKMNRDLDEIGKIWYEGRYGFKYHRRSLIVSLQKELSTGHYLLGKGEMFELRPLTVEELVDFYIKKFKTTWPFDTESLRLIALISRGIFRRFMRYIGMCARDMKYRGTESIGIDDVKRVISPEVISKDLELEFSGFLKGSEKTLAVRVLSTLMAEGKMNQKELAEKLGSTESSVTRLLQKLELKGYIIRERGDRKELRVMVKS